MSPGTASLADDLDVSGTSVEGLWAADRGRSPRDGDNHDSFITDKATEVCVV